MKGRIKYLGGFESWLLLQNYAQKSIKSEVERLRRFINYMEANGVLEMSEIKGEMVMKYFEVLSHQKSRKTGKVLKQSTIRNHLTTLNRFTKYLRLTEQINLVIPVKFKGEVKSEIVVLSKGEIEQLYRVTGSDLLGIRDRMMLSIFYGCGVRKSEAVHIKIQDVLEHQNLLFIRTGKGYRERYVPMVGRVKKDIVDYLVTARPMMMGNRKSEALFIGVNGRPLKGSSLYERFKKLVKLSRIEKKAGLHTLRHSIATHLLLNGMKLSEIAKFLGHQSLESTQIYTHLKDET